MGTTMSMDLSGVVIEDPLAMNSTETTTTTTSTTSTTTTTTGIMSFEDKLRQEVILIPEDIQDIHIQASADADNADLTGSSSNVASVVEGQKPSDDNSRYGKGKHWKKNMKKKQAAAASTTVVPIATERTIEQRRDQIRPIIDKLTELQMNVSYPAIRELYKQLSQFVRTGEDAKIKIAFPEFSRKIKGELSNAPYIPCWVKLEMD
jgi:hypothetical protein